MKKEAGSTLPLVIGLAVMVLTLTLTTSEIQSLYQLKQATLSEARLAALKVAQDIQGLPVVGADYTDLAKPLEIKAQAINVQSEDGKTIEAKVCALWKPNFLPVGQSIICEAAQARKV